MLNLAVVAGFYKFLITRGPLWSIWTPTPPLEPAASPAGIPHAPAKISDNVFLGSRARPSDQGAD